MMGRDAEGKKRGRAEGDGIYGHRESSEARERAPYLIRGLLNLGGRHGVKALNAHVLSPA
jgi:hypothetical protein